MASNGANSLLQRFSYCLNGLFFAHLLLLYFSGSIYIRFTSGNFRKVIMNDDYTLDDPEKLTLIYMITPTYHRENRKADLTRLAQTLRQVPNFYWIIVEDGPKKVSLVENLVRRLNINYYYVAAPTPNYTALELTKPINKGVYQRNVGLEWLRWTYKGKESQAPNAVVYFGDDDNTYDLRLFEKMRNIKTAGVWPVALVGGVKLEKPLMDSKGQLTGFDVGFAPMRLFAMDMAGFALNLKLVLERPNGHFPLNSIMAWNEPELFRTFNLTYDDVTPMCFDVKTADGKIEALVWHTKTQPVDLGQELRFRREHSNRAPDEGFEI